MTYLKIRVYTYINFRAVPETIISLNFARRESIEKSKLSFNFLKIDIGKYNAFQANTFAYSKILIKFVT